MKCTHVCAAQITTNLQIEPDFPCLAGEIAEPRPDMNIKVTAFIKIIHAIIPFLTVPGTEVADKHFIDSLN